MNLKTLSFALFLLAPLALPTAFADPTTLGVSMDESSYNVVDTLTGTKIPQATVTVLDDEGGAVDGAEVRLVFLRQVQFIGYVSNETVIGTTGADGTFTTNAPQNSRLPGTYVVVAFAGDIVESTSYTIGA